MSLFNEKDLILLCQNNMWLKKDSTLLSQVRDYKFKEFITIKELIDSITKRSWPIGQGFIYDSLCFINQINYGDGWWTIKRFSDGRLRAFDSIAFLEEIERRNSGSEKTINKVIEDLNMAQSYKKLETAWSNEKSLKMCSICMKVRHEDEMTRQRWLHKKGNIEKWYCNDNPKCLSEAYLNFCLMNKEVSTI